MHLIPLRRFFHQLDRVETELCNLKSYKAIESILQTVTLHGLQCVDILKMLYQKRAVVIYPTGTGKTLLAAGALKLLLRKDPTLHFIMFVKKDQLIQTPEKLTKFLGFSVIGSSADRKSLEKNFFNVDLGQHPLILLTHECLRNQSVLNFLYQKRELFSGIIIDEAHELNNYTKAESGEMLAAVTHNFEYVWALTATPITTEIQQLAKLAFIVDRSRYTNVTLLQRNLRSGRFSVSSDPMFFINRTEKELGRESKPVGLVQWVDPMSHQKNTVCGGVELMQLCKGDGAVNQANSLVKVIKKLGNRKGLIFVNQVSIRNWIKPFLDDAGISYACINGDTTQAARKEIMHNFNDLNLYDVIITSVTTAIDLDSDYVIFYEFTVEVDQMIGRAHRGLGNKQLLVIFMITRGTAEIRYFLENVYGRCMTIQHVLGKGNAAVIAAGEEVGASGVKD